MSTEIVRVVAHLQDGTLYKGTTADFYPNRPSFHIQPGGGGEAITVRCRSMKALFYVKNFEGNKARRDLRGFLAAAPETAKGPKVAVLFKDGELLCGYSLGYSSEREGFFVFPADVGSNNLRMYVIISATREIKIGPAADQMVQRALAKGAS